MALVYRDFVQHPVGDFLGQFEVHRFVDGVAHAHFDTCRPAIDLPPVARAAADVGVLGPHLVFLAKDRVVGVGQQNARAHEADKATGVKQLRKQRVSSIVEAFREG
jgi:hypothetical protein